VPDADHGWRLAADLLHWAFARLRLYFLLGGAGAGRLDAYATAPPARSGFYLIDSARGGDPATFWASLKQLVPPAVTLGLFAWPHQKRMTRGDMLGRPGGRLRAHSAGGGLGRGTVLFVYACNAMLPVITTLGMVFSFLGANVLSRRCSPGPASAPMRWRR
jgi:peptide/nickel transport system permease protein